MPPNNDVIFIQPPNDGDKIPQYKQSIVVNIFHFYIIDEIGDPRDFLDMINIIKTAEEHDTIFIYLNTPGGSLQTTIQILGAIQQCQGTVVTCLEGEVCSAGTLIFLTGDRHIVNQNCTFMIHNYSQWLGGKGNEVALRVKYSEQYFRKLAYDLYKGFLTDDEIESVMQGKDYWMDSEEVIARLNARNLNLEAVAKALQAGVNSISTERVNEVSEKVIDQETTLTMPEPKPAPKKRVKKAAPKKR